MIEVPMALALSAFSFLLTVIWGPPLLQVLRNLKIGEHIRIDGPSRHLSKIGTPTMGGILIVIPVLFLTILFNAGSFFGLSIFGNSILVPLITLILYALIGSVDDWAGLRGQEGSDGLSPRMKLIAQTIVAFGTALVLRYFLRSPELYLPGLDFEISFGVLYVPIATFIIVASSNAVNLTDGLDGLAGLISVTAFITYGAIALMQGQIFLARFCFILVGAIFGFLWFNVYPAELFMGDTGSLALGAVLAVVALMTGQWAILPVIAIIPLSETISVIIQVSYFKLTGGRRVFKMTPLHHHFELSGWSETQVVQRFWLISLVAAIVGIALSLV
ncbi:MAG: phospho-N-acetylmuramoyl-pentapeptide-transferase [Anaerolineaceae bacterium 4572_5.1]|nr:MAG: phospho-N-acetylmuramoyl-pentapeptide-transferase [Anaerolineaceae bacterium 4572_5.1]RLD08734.1 MAG: phospho-N-acetylmuramoyl-pentapeptide-transferase [Chloroflexota bacterium]